MSTETPHETTRFEFWQVSELLTLARTAAELWSSTGGSDPHGVLSARQSELLDLAEETYRTESGEDDDGGHETGVCDCPECFRRVNGHYPDQRASA